MTPRTNVSFLSYLFPLLPRMQIPFTQGFFLQGLSGSKPCEQIAGIRATKTHITSLASSRPHGRSPKRHIFFRRFPATRIPLLSRSHSDKTTFPSRQLSPCLHCDLLIALMGRHLDLFRAESYRISSSTFPFARSFSTGSPHARFFCARGKRPGIKARGGSVWRCQPLIH